MKAVFQPASLPDAPLGAYSLSNTQVLHRTKYEPDRSLAGYNASSCNFAFAYDSVAYCSIVVMGK